MSVDRRPGRLSMAAMTALIGTSGLGNPMSAGERNIVLPPIVISGEMPSLKSSIPRKGSESLLLNLEAVRPEYIGFLEVLDSLVKVDAEPEFFALMKKRLASDPDKYFAHAYIIGVKGKDPKTQEDVETPSGVAYAYFPDIDIQEPNEVTYGLYLFVNDPGNNDSGEAPAAIDLQFNEFGRLTRTEESLLSRYEFTIEGLTTINDRYLKTTDEVKSLPWYLYLDPFGNPSYSYIVRTQDDNFGQRMTFSGYATNRAMFVPHEILPVAGSRENPRTLRPL